jgi:hypothetical protein
MKQDSAWALTAGALLTLFGVLVIEALFLPSALGMSMVPMGAFAIFLWLNGYRVSKKRQIH